MIQLPPDFFQEYWQKKPCVLKAATTWRPMISPEELAGIACEEDSRARIIRDHQTEGPDRWELLEGPFDEAIFNELPESHWTLLVQEVNTWDEQVAELLKAVPVLPCWRVDDVMVSYAVDQGSVGPHYDYYDVFLLQGLGQRCWQIGPACNDDTPRLLHEDLLLLDQMPVLEQHILSPGDILYLPPGIAHWGKAQGECLTFSIGFRAPSAAEALQELADQIHPLLPDQQRYQDSPELINYHQAVHRPHEIAAAAIAQYRALIHNALTDERIAQWLGCRTTETEQRLPLLEELTDERFQLFWATGQFIPHAQNRMAWHQDPVSSTVHLFCNGLQIQIETGLSGAEEAAYLQTFCENPLLDVQQPPLSQNPATKDIIRWLLEQEAIVPID